MSHKYTYTPKRDRKDSDLLIASHVRWKLKFQEAIASKTKFDVTIISKDDCCVLGKWLYGSDIYMQLNNLQSYRECLKKHSLFHTEAGRFARLINAGAYDTAQQLLDDGESNYNRASTDVINAIFEMEKDVTEEVTNNTQHIAITPYQHHDEVGNFNYSSFSV